MVFPGLGELHPYVNLLFPGLGGPHLYGHLLFPCVCGPNQYVNLLFPGLGGPHLYVVDSSMDEIYTMSFLGGPMIPLNVSSWMRDPRGITYDAERNFLYWTDRADTNKIIGRLSLNDHTVEIMNLTSGMTISFYSCIPPNHLSMWLSVFGKIILS